MTLQQVKEWVGKNRAYVIAVVAILALVGAYGAGRMAAPAKVVKETKTEVQWQTKLEYRDVEVVKWQTQYVDRWNTQYATKVDENTECSEDFDVASGKLTHRVCKTIKKTDTTASNDGEKQGGSSGEKDTVKEGTQSEQGKAKTDEKITTNNTYDNYRLGLMVNTHWNKINFTDPWANIQLGVTGEYRLFWKLWAGGYAIPSNKEVGLQLSLTF
jgi:hypothetical protein